MTGQHTPQALVGLPPAMLGLLMPFYLLIAPTGNILSVGPTLEKLMPGGFVGARFLEVFELKRPRGMFTLAQLAVVESQRMQLVLRAGDITTTFHGQAMLLPAGQGAIINLGLGVGLAETVAGHGLTHADFAPTDLSVEMLYLAEAKSAVADEMAELNRRLRRARAEAEDQAQTDALTGLQNRRALDAAMLRITTESRAFALMHMDLDFFKEVNDSLGHAAGDLVLQHMARILREETRTGDVLARVGGDEFVVILDGVRDQARVDAVAGRILNRLAEPVLFEGQPCHVSASIGTTLSQNYALCDPDRMHADADGALYASKRAGRCRATAWSAEQANETTDANRDGASATDRGQVPASEMGQDMPVRRSESAAQAGFGPTIKASAENAAADTARCPRLRDVNAGLPPVSSSGAVGAARMPTTQKSAGITAG
ncbi:MAG: diguanylate cyclase domain-containing protein [Paracoccaceae bacterium]